MVVTTLLIKIVSTDAILNCDSKRIIDLVGSIIAVMGDNNKEMSPDKNVSVSSDKSTNVEPEKMLITALANSTPREQSRLLPHPPVVWFNKYFIVTWYTNNKKCYSIIVQ